MSLTSWEMLDLKDRPGEEEQESEEDDECEEKSAGEPLERSLGQTIKIEIRNSKHIHVGDRFDFLFTELDRVPFSRMLSSSSSMPSLSGTKETAFSTPSEVPRDEQLLKCIQEHLRNVYSSEFYRLTSLDWLRDDEEVRTSRNHYVPPNLVKSDDITTIICGVGLEEIFNSDQGLVQPPRRIIVVGEGGVGKTTLCAKLAHDWSIATITHWLSYYISVFLLKVRRCETGSLDDAIVSCLMSLLGNCSKDFTEESIISIISKYSNKILLLVDGCDENFSTEEIRNFFSSRVTGNKQWLNKATILFTSRPMAACKVTPFFARCIVLQGFSHYQRLDLVKKYFEDEKGKRQSLLKMLKNKSMVSSLGENPLVLKMICYIHDKAVLNRILKSRECGLSEVYTTFLYLLVYQHIIGDDRFVEDSEIAELRTSAIKNLGGHFLKDIGILKEEDKCSFHKRCYNEFHLLKNIGILTKSSSTLGISSNKYDLIHTTFLEYSASVALSHVSDIDVVVMLLGKCNTEEKPSNKDNRDFLDKDVNYPPLSLDSAKQIQVFLQRLIKDKYPELLPQLETVLSDPIQNQPPPLITIQINSPSMVVGEQGAPHSKLVPNMRKVLLPGEISLTETATEVPSIPSQATLVQPLLNRCLEDTSLSDRSSKEYDSLTESAQISLTNEMRFTASYESARERYTRTQSRIDRERIRELSINLSEDVYNYDKWKRHLNILQSGSFIVLDVLLQWDLPPSVESEQFNRLCRALEGQNFHGNLYVSSDDFSNSSTMEMHCHTIAHLFQLSYSGDLVIQVGKNGSDTFTETLYASITATVPPNSSRRSYKIAHGKRQEIYEIRWQTGQRTTVEFFKE